MGEPFIGEIRMFAGNFPPNGWAMCDGQLMPISQNDALFILLGTTFGGDGQETFALPNLQSRIPMHSGTGADGNSYQVGESGGTESVTLTIQQIPNHTHPHLGSTAFGQNPQPQNGVWASVPTGKIYVSSAPGAQLAANHLAPVGGSQPHENMVPYLVINFIISLFGVFPQPN